MPSIQGAGRIDNPEHYAVFYAATTAVAAIGESFGDLREWFAAMLGPRPNLPGSAMALATLSAPSALIDLDDPSELVARDLRPSRVITRDRRTTQAWALDIWREGAHDGVQWWSRRDADWVTTGVWTMGAMRVVASEPLTIGHPKLAEAAEILAIPVRE